MYIFAEKLKYMDKKKRNLSGKNNPHYGCRHSEESKKRISESQKERFRKFKEAMEFMENYQKLNEQI